MEQRKRKPHEHLPQQTRKRVRFAEHTEVFSPPTASDDIDASSSSSSSSIGTIITVRQQADFPASLIKPQVPELDAVATVDLFHDLNSSKPSLEIVPYIAPDPRLFTLYRKEDNLSPRFDPQAPLSSALPYHVLHRESCDSPRGVRLKDSGALQLGPVLPRANFGGNQGEKHSKWVIVSTEQVEQTVKKMREQAEKNKSLETTVKSHKRARILIYDAAMKQAEKRKEEGIHEVKRTFEREQGEMRQEVDRELGKISDLYQERCRDYAMMVSDECEGETSKAATDLRRDWKRQKKTIDQLVRSDGEEDRQLAVIARAVMERLQEETKDEMAVRRADIYTDVKMEFESREVALRAALESDFQADLEGQLLLAEARHQKEMEQLRMELGGGKAPSSAEAATRAVIVYSARTPQRKGKGDGKFDATSSIRPPLLSKRPRQQKMDVGVAADENSSDVGGAGGMVTPSGKRAGLGRKFPLFKTPVRKVSPDVGNKKAGRPADCSANKPIPMPRMRTKEAIHTPKATAQDDDLKTTPIRKQQSELDGSITSALLVSPTKAIPGVVTPSINTDEVGSSGQEMSRPKKRAKRLFSTACP